MFLPEFIGFPIGLYVDKLKEKELTHPEEDGTQRGHVRHEDHFLLEGRPVRVPGGTTLEGSGDVTP